MLLLLLLLLLLLVLVATEETIALDGEFTLCELFKIEILFPPFCYTWLELIFGDERELKRLFDAPMDVLILFPFIFADPFMINVPILFILLL